MTPMSKPLPKLRLLESLGATAVCPIGLDGEDGDPIGGIGYAGDEIDPGHLLPNASQR